MDRDGTRPCPEPVCPVFTGDGHVAPTTDGDNDDQNAIPDRNSPTLTDEQQEIGNAAEAAVAVESPDNDDWGEWQGQSIEPDNRTGANRRPRAPNQPGRRHRGAVQGAAAKAAAGAGAALVVTGAGAHSFVQICDSEHVTAAYQVIAVLIALLFLVVFSMLVM